MAHRTQHFNGNNPSTPEHPVVETPPETTIMTETAPSETDEEPFSLTPLVEAIKPTLNELEGSGLKAVIDYCSNRLDELQQEEVESLESQMRAIQDRLIQLKGRNGAASGTRNVKPIVNPANPSEFYTAGMTPYWLRELVNSTGKSIAQLREESPEIRGEK